MPKTLTIQEDKLQLGGIVAQFRIKGALNPDPVDKWCRQSTKLLVMVARKPADSGEEFVTVGTAECLDKRPVGCRSLGVSGVNFGEAICHLIHDVEGKA